MFQFKQFTIKQDLCAMKVGTDGVLLGAWAELPQNSIAGNGQIQRVLDIGTGTGLIALMMAQRFKDAQITALDIDGDAVQQALQNVEASPFATRINVIHQQVQHHEGTYDAIVCNPPFFIHALSSPDMQRNMARHACTLTYAELMAAAKKNLTEGGELSVVIPFDYRQRMEDEAIFAGLFLSRRCGVSTTKNKPPRRFLLAFRKHPCQVETEQMVLGDNHYRTLTSDFYLDKE